MVSQSLSVVVNIQTLGGWKRRERRGKEGGKGMIKKGKKKRRKRMVESQKGRITGTEDELN